MKTLMKLAVLACAAIGNVSGATGYPERPVRMIVPFGAGSSTDITARLIGVALSKELGQSVIVENKPGAGGVIGTDLVAKSKADGYTLSFGSVGTFAINKGLYSKLSYDPSKDFTYLAMPGYTPTLLVVGKDSPYKTLKELLDAARQNPGKLAFASAGNGTSGHLAGELLKKVAGVSMLHIPYKEGAQAMTDTISGQVAFMFYHPVAVMPHVRSGALRALAASSSKRSALAPDVPTIAESGYKGFDLTAWYMLAAPVGMPRETEKKLLAAANKALQDPTVRDALKKQGVEGEPMDPQKIPGFVSREIKKWGNVIDLAHARID
mgnify:CR=1 FL=1